MNMSPSRRRCPASGGSTSPHVTKKFGSLRMYAIPHNDPRVQVVRSLDTAFAEFGVTPGEFEPLPA